MSKLFSICLIFVVSIGYAQDDSLAQFEKVVLAEGENASHDKSTESDRHFKPIIKGLLSSNPDIRRRAGEYLYPLFKTGRIALDQFDEIGWDKFDANGKGVYLWCSARRRTWGNEPLGFPLKPEITVNLWKAAIKEPVALPFLKETALTWHGVRCSGWNPVWLGDHLVSVDRKKLTFQYCSVLNGCKLELEQNSVAWMIIELQSSEDQSLQEWYATQADPAARTLLLASLDRIFDQKDSSNLGDLPILQRKLWELKKRLPMLRALTEVASRDWNQDCLAAAKTLSARLEYISATEAQPEPEETQLSTTPKSIEDKSGGF